MKFAKHLQDEVVPEWRKAYINYKQGKKYLKAIQAAIDRLQKEQVESPIQCLNPVPTEDGLAALPPVGPVQPSIVTSEPDMLGPESESVGPLVPTYSLQITSDSPTGSTPINSHGHVKSYDTIQTPSHPTPPPPSIAASAPGKILSDVEGNSLDSVKDQLLDEERQFFKFLDEQLTMVNDFYRDKELEAGTKLKILKQQLYVADEWKRRYDNKMAKARSDRAWYRNEWSKVRKGIGKLMVDSEATQDVTLGHANHAHSGSASGGQQNGHTDSSEDTAADLSTGAKIKRIQELRQRESRGAVDERSMKQLPADQVSYLDQLVVEDEENRRQRMNHSVARARIKTALYEFYRSLEMLKNYKALNNTGFIKIMKKFDKTAGWKASRAFVASKLRPAYFMSSSALDDLFEETENLFIEKFENGQRRRGKSFYTLKINFHLCSYHNAASARVGLYLGASIPLFVLGIQGVLSVETQARIPYWEYLLLIYAGLLVPILFSCLVGVNMYTWTKARINYKFIFEFDPRDNLDFHEYFELPAFFILIIALTLYFEFASSLTEYAATGYYPLIAICVIFGILLCPLPIANWDARRWFLQSMGRIIISGYYHVEFRDFFLADEMNSLAYSFEQFELAICVYSRHWSSVENEHLNNCGQFRAIKDIPLPFHIHVEGESDEEDEDVVTEGDNNDALRSGSATSDIGGQAEAIAEGSGLGSNAAVSTAATQRKQSRAQPPSVIRGPTSRSSSQASIHSTASSGQPDISHGLRRSTTFVDDAMVEAGFGDDRREQLSAASKFYNRRDFDSKIEGSADGMFRIRRRSTVSTPQQSGLGTGSHNVGTRPDELVRNTTRKSIKNSMFSRKTNTDEDDTDTDEP
ncbi:hypothetical protein BGX20_003157 [Mortierella sp. AD010]|nr:hypothetical protein BGX20_003157 [Mortierella sp. AD010]